MAVHLVRTVEFGAKGIFFFIAPYHILSLEVHAQPGQNIEKGISGNLHKKQSCLFNSNEKSLVNQLWGFRKNGWILEKEKRQEKYP
jgi:hypothetical protein